MSLGALAEAERVGGSAHEFAELRIVNAVRRGLLARSAPREHGDHTDVIIDDITFFNNGAEVMFGYTKDEIVGRNVTRIMPERYREGHDGGMRRLRETGEAHVIGRTVELHGLRKNGEEFPLELSLSMWRAGGETLFTGIMRDITERHAAAEALLRSGRELERLNDELRRSNRELQDFAYVASHDLQEPLRKIHSFADLLAAEHAAALDELGVEPGDRVAIVSQNAAADRILDELKDDEGASTPSHSTAPQIAARTSPEAPRIADSQAAGPCETPNRPSWAVFRGSSDT